MGSSNLPKMLGVKRMPRPLSESRKPESRRKTAVLRGMRLRLIDSPPDFPGQPCAAREREDPQPIGWEGEQWSLKFGREFAKRIPRRAPRRGEYPIHLKKGQVWG